MKAMFITGASGNVGREVVAALRKHHVPMVIGARSPSRIDAAPGQSVVLFDFLDSATYTSAIDQCSAMFLLRPPAISNTKATLNKVIDAARAAGVKHIVFISVAGADTNLFVPHHAVEVHLRAGPPGWTILRPGFFAQNLESAYCEDIRDDNRNYVPAGCGRVAFVNTRDLAAVAVKALLSLEAHDGQAYTFTGPAALSFNEVAQLLSATLGRTVRYEPASAVSYAYHLIHAGLPLAQALVQAILHIGLRFGQAATVDPTLPRLLGRAPLTMAEYIGSHSHVWLAR